ncbi:hypothetical protein CSC2_25660 [Clostridium zeae]|uniref:FtsW/RodA/SpoVE family cell cycle protein n=1 Tax=Clostridium zeae TaxID=2759022 RepID=A0ABQ1EBM1_9CLOT|nr:FtsW/RodA/SpoVE family cell cycle protein [Clostridium zeae]GFZ32040.1 hypothetical protein CSC2_25660 [Clostridium zeae]
MGIEKNSFDKFTEEVCSLIKCTEVHKDIKEELACHLEDIKEEYIAQGSSFQEAEKLAISHIGDSEKIGFDLNKVYKKVPEYKTLIICSLFVAFGLFTQFSIFKNAPKVMSYSNYITTIVCTILGSLIAITAYLFDYRKIEKYSWQIYFITNFVFLLIVSFPYKINLIIGIKLVGKNFDIALAAIILNSIALNGILPKLTNVKYSIIKKLSLIALCIYLILISNQYFCVALFSIFSIILLVNSKIKIRYIIATIGASISVIYFAMFTTQYRYYRLIDLLNFRNNTSEVNSLNEIIQKIISASNLFGNGISTEILSNTPVINEGLIYTYIIYTFGWVVALTLLILILFLLINLFRTSKSIKNQYGRNLFTLISFILAVEFLLSVALNLNLIPFVSAFMPFLGYSPFSTVVNLTLIGIICSIYGRKNLSKSLVKTKLQINN